VKSDFVNRREGVLRPKLAVPVPLVDVLLEVELVNGKGGVDEVMFVNVALLVAFSGGKVV